MKKFSLFIATLFMSVTMFAQTAAFYAQGSTAPASGDDVVIATGEIVGQTFTNAAASIVITKVNESSVSNVQKNEVRWYAQDVMTVTPVGGATITKIVWNTVKNSKGAPSATVGTITGTGVDEGVVTWEGSITAATEFKAEKQVRFSSMVITYTAGTPVALTDLAIDPATASVEVGKTVALKAVKTPANATATLVWETSDATIATVANGVVTGVKEGTATITASEGAIKATAVVKVVAAAPVEVITPSKAAELAAAGDKGTYNIEGYVTKQYYDYDAKNDYQSFWMADEKGGKGVFVAWRVKGLKENVKVGSKVRIENAMLTTYKETKETVANAQFVVLEEGEAVVLPTNITGVKYADAYYYLDEDDYPTWDIEVYADYNETTKEIVYPYLYFMIDANSETSLNGTYGLYYAGYWYTENDSVEVNAKDDWAGTLTITHKSNDVYNMNAKFEVDGVTYTLNQDVSVWAYNDDEGTEIELNENATAIEENTEKAVKVNKVMRDGKVFIINAKQEYTIDGKMVK